MATRLPAKAGTDQNESEASENNIAGKQGKPLLGRQCELNVRNLFLILAPNVEEVSDLREGKGCMETVSCRSGNSEIELELS